MRKIILIAAVAFAACTTIPAAAQGQAVFLKQIPKVTTGGHFNSSTLAGGSATASSVIERESTVFPLYSCVDTISNTETDELSQKITGWANSVYTWVSVTGITGTNTSCTLKLQVSGDTNTGTVWKTIQTFTVTASGEYNALITGWPYTNLRWLFTGVATHSSSWYGGFFLR